MALIEREPSAELSTAELVYRRTEGLNESRTFVYEPAGIDRERPRARVGGHRDIWSMPSQSSIFETNVRMDGSPSRHNEPIAVFLNRVAGGYWDQIRALIDLWVERYPSGARADLVGRLQSPDNRQWGAAFWELYLHESFLRSGHMVEVHPTVSTGPRPPDFLVSSGVNKFYVEAKAIFGKQTAGADARLRAVYDAINSINSPNFFVNVDVRRTGAGAPSTRRLKVDLEKWLGSLDPDNIDLHDLLSPTGKRHIWRQDDWELEFRPIPIKPGARGREEHRPLGSWGPAEAYPFGDQAPLREALDEKGRAYGRLEHPLLLALHINTGFDRTFETMNALYGSASVVFNATSPHGAHDIRLGDGYFGSPGDWRHRHVSGVLIGPNISPWIVSTVAPTMWSHPAPQSAIPALPIWHEAVLDGDHVETRPAVTPPHELFDLAEGWPIGDPFPHD